MKRLLFALVFVMLATASFADSPLTSTRFYQHYEKFWAVQEAETNGTMTPELISYLLDDTNPVEVRVAAINALGWNIDGTQNYDMLAALAIIIKGYNSEKQLLKKVDGGTLVVLAYCKAMSDYFNVDEAVKMSKMAQKKDKKSLCVNFIAALIQSQKMMHDGKWSQVFTVVNDVLVNPKFNKDMLPEAIESVMEYISIY